MVAWIACFFALLAGPSAKADEPVAAAGTMCEPGWIARTYRDTRASVVRIENADGLGSGFVFYSPRYVATAFHVVALGREITVTSADGARQPATIALVDQAHDLAILQLEHEIAGARPLVPNTDPLPIGTPVLIIGHPFALLDRYNQSLQGLLYWTATQGILSGRSEGYLQTDAAVNPGNSGGPLLSCDGRVLGVVSAKLEAEAIGFAVPTQHLLGLTKEIGRQGPYLGRVTGGWQVDLWLQADPSFTWLGFGLGFQVVAYDRWSTALRGGPLWASSTPPDGPVLDTGGFRLFAELSESYRLLLLQHPLPIYLTLGLGVAGSIDRISTTTLSTQAMQPTQPIAIRGHSTSYLLWPDVLASLLLGQSLEIGYAYQANLKDLGPSTHRVLLGISF
jgi:hypothetical protein